MGLLHRVAPMRIRNAVQARRARRMLAKSSDLAFAAKKLSQVTPADLAQWWKNPDAGESADRCAKLAEPFLAPDGLGGVNPGDQRALHHIVHKLRPRKILEIGTHVGCSTVHLALAQQSAGLKPDVTTVDIRDVNAPEGPWHEVGAPCSPKTALELVGIHGGVEFVQRPSMEFLRDGTDQYDLIFLDGDHSSVAVYQEISAALPRLTPNGVILLHDVYPNAKPLFPNGVIIHGPWLAAQRIMREAPNLQILPVGELPWPTKEGSHASSLAVVTRHASR